LQEKNLNFGGTSSNLIGVVRVKLNMYNNSIGCLPSPNFDFQQANLTGSSQKLLKLQKLPKIKVYILKIET
jgi:hypothetical protein